MIMLHYSFQFLLCFNPTIVPFTHILFILLIYIPTKKSLNKQLPIIIYLSGRSDDTVVNVYDLTTCP